METYIKLTEVRSKSTSIPFFYARYLTSVHCVSCPPCAVWRIIVGVSLVPAFATLYHRLTLPEAKKFTDSQKQGSQTVDSPTELKKNNGADTDSSTNYSKSEKSPVIIEKKSHWSGMSPSANP